MAIKYPKPGLLNGVAPRSTRTYFTDADDAITISQKLNKQSNNTNYTSLKGLVVKELARPGGGKTIFVYFDVLHYSISKTLSPDNAEYFLTRVDIDVVNKDDGSAEGTIVEVSFQNGDYQTGFLTKVIGQGSGSPDSATVQSTNFLNPCARPSTSVVDTVADNASALSAKGVSTTTSIPAQPTPVADPCVGGPLGPPAAGQIKGVPFKNIGFRNSGKLKQQRLIVMHQSVTSTAEKAHEVLIAKNCSVHFTVDRNGSSEQNLEIDKSGVHAGGMNPRSIAIEHINPGSGWSPYFKNYQLQAREHYEASYQIVNQLCEITKILKITLPYSYAASSKGEGWFLAQGKLPVGYELSPNISGIIAHGVSTLTDHTDGLFETLYVQYRFLNNDAANAWNKANITLGKIKRKEGLVKGETIEWNHKNHKTGIEATIKTQNYFIKLEP